MPPVRRKKANNNKGEEEGGQGGKSGEIEFHDFLQPAPQRDDFLPANQEKPLLREADRLHREHVKKEKAKRENYKALKTGRIAEQAFRQGLRGGTGRSLYQAHPILSNKAQFSGITDVTVTPDPTNNKNTDTANEADRNELENQYRLRLGYEPRPKSTPQLKR